MNVTALIKTHLAADATVIAALDAFDSAPAVFNDRAPDPFVFGEDLAIIIAAPTSNEPDDTFTSFGREIRRDIRLYGRDKGSTLALDNLAEHVRTMFHAKPAEAVTGGTVTFATASGPVDSPTTDPSLIGRRVTLRILTEEN